MVENVVTKTMTSVLIHSLNTLVHVWDLTTWHWLSQCLTVTMNLMVIISEGIGTIPQRNPRP